MSWNWVNGTFTERDLKRQFERVLEFSGNLSPKELHDVTSVLHKAAEKASKRHYARKAASHASA